MKNYKMHTGRYEDAAATEALNKLQSLIPADLHSRAVYEVVYSHYHKARETVFSQLPYSVQEVKSFPIYEDYCRDTLWTVAEFRGEHGEHVQFTREGTTMVDWSYETWAE